MKGKNLIVLVVIAVVLCGLAYLSSVKKRRGGETMTLIGKPVLAALQDTEKLNSIVRLVFQSADSVISVARVADVWVAPDKFDYPVDFDKVRDFLRKLSELKIGQMAASDRQQLERLELVSPRDAAAGQTNGVGTLVKLQDSAGELVASILIGKQHTRAPPSDSPYPDYGGYPDGRYLLADGEACLVTDALSGIPNKVQDWLDKDIANVSSYDTVELTVSGPGGKSLTLRRPEGSGDLALDDLADNEEMDTSKVNGVAGTLGYLTFLDVADPSLSDEQLGFDKPVTYIARNNKDQVYTLLVGGSLEGSEGRCVRLSASYTPPPEEESEEVQPTVEEGAAEKAREEARKKMVEQGKLVTEIRELNEKVGRWTYLVSSYKVDNLTVDRADYVKEKEEPEEAQETSTQKKGD